MKNWDEDPEADGIEATIAPRDKDDKMQYAVGVVNAKAYERNLNTSTYKYEKENWSEWSNISITKDQYGFLGALCDWNLIKLRASRPVISGNRIRLQWKNV